MDSMEALVMKTKIWTYFENLKPSQLGLKDEVRISSVKKLGMGSSNLNYVVEANGKKFIFRMNVDTHHYGKSKREYDALKLVEKLGIAPKAYILDESKKEFDETFIIIEYLEGGSLDKIGWNSSIIRKLAQISAKIHNVPLNRELLKLRREETDLENYIQAMDEPYRYSLKHTKNQTFHELLIETFDKLKLEINGVQYKKMLTLTQGDFCEQNVIIDKGEVKLIDWENLGLTDPAAELTHIFLDFGRPFTKEQKNIFLEEYKKIRKDPEIEIRIGNYTPLKYYYVFLWAIAHALKIKNKEMHEEFLKSNDYSKDIAFADRAFHHALKAGVIDKKFSEVNVEEILR